MKRMTGMKKGVVLLVAAVISLCLAGCSGTTTPMKNIEAGGMTISYPESWGNPETMDGGQILGVRAKNALIVKPEGADEKTAIAISDTSDSDLKLDTLKKTLVEQAGLDVEEAQIDGKSVLKATGNADGAKVFSVIAHDNGTLKSMMVATIATTDYDNNKDAYDAMVGSVSLA